MNCDRIAGLYRWLECFAFGGALERRRGAFLGQLANARRVLVVGDGDGRALEELLKAAPFATVDYVDSSGEMLALARERSGNDRVTYHHADVLTLALPHGEYDAIVTHFFLDCLNDEDAAALVARVAAAARPDARWLISEFQQASPWTSIFVRALYLFFRMTTGLRTNRVVDYRALLAGRDFHLVRKESAWRGLLLSELWIR
jgi:ubiquinone/menaquinone biosynthesis C-methylase UbiE